jgi:hypothetical protein
MMPREMQQFKKVLPFAFWKVWRKIVISKMGKHEAEPTIVLLSEHDDALHLECALEDGDYLLGCVNDDKRLEAVMRRSEWKQWAWEDWVAKMEEGGTTAAKRKACTSGGGIASGGDGGVRRYRESIHVASFFNGREFRRAFLLLFLTGESSRRLYAATINTDSEGSRTSIPSCHPCRLSSIQWTKLF